jgi:hypothetical protein
MIRFRPITPQRWAGHYERIPGETTTFHVDTNDRISIYWDDPYSGDRLRSPARSSEDMLELGAAVNRVKLRYGSYRGGSFAINEFGQIIVPLQGTGARYLVGTVEGSLLFQSPDDNGKYFTLNAPEGIRPGQIWDRPYVGMPFHLANSGVIYRILDDEGDRLVDFLVFRDIPLIQQLHKIRGWRGCRFLVNYLGVVLTKHEHQGLWLPLYVGTLDYTQWYSRSQ